MNYKEKLIEELKYKNLQYQSFLLKMLSIPINFMSYDHESQKIGLFNIHMNNTGYILVQGNNLINVTENVIDARIVDKIISEIENK